MKKLLSILFVVVLVAAMTVPSVFAAEETTVTVSDVSAEAGTTVTVDVTITNNPGFISGKVTLSYDSSVMELVALENVLFQGYANVETAMANHASVDPVTDNGTLVTATFALKEDAAAGSYTVSASVSGMRNAAGTLLDINGDVGVGSVTVEPSVCEHSWDSGIVTTPAGCETEGVMTYTCTLCRSTKVETIPATGHTYGEWVQTKAPTCTEKGEETRTCSCGETETREIAAIGHTYGEWTQTKAPTCTEKGEETRTCSCGETETREIAAKGHALNTMEHDDNYHWYVCDNCDYVGEKQAHDYDNSGYCKCGGKNASSETPKDPELDDVPPTGDITPVIVMSTVFFACLVIVAVAIILKRKSFVK